MISQILLPLWPSGSTHAATSRAVTQIVIPCSDSIAANDEFLRKGEEGDEDSGFTTIDFPGAAVTRAHRSTPAAASYGPTGIVSVARTMAFCSAEARTRAEATTMSERPIGIRSESRSWERNSLKCDARWKEYPDGRSYSKRTPARDLALDRPWDGI